HVGDHPVLERAHGRDPFRSPAEHPLRLQTDPLDLPRRLLDCHHRGLIQDDPLALHIDEGIRRAKVDRNVVYRDERSRGKPPKSHVSPSKPSLAAGDTLCPPINSILTEAEKLP